VAFAASIGGLATPIGTPPNLIGLAFIRDQLGVNVSFLGWCAIGVPVAAVLATIAVRVLAQLFPAGVERLDGVSDYVAAERMRLGGWTTGQRSTALAFAITVALWVLPGLVLMAAAAIAESRASTSAWLATVHPAAAAIVGEGRWFMRGISAPIRPPASTPWPRASSRAW
jgi:sodium-dependent dicarboxylate transporter 2/3/5